MNIAATLRASSGVTILARMIDVRFATNLQILLSLALAREDGAPRLASAQLADSLGANPALVRTLLVTLARHDLVKTAKGKTGGVELARPADTITLGDIYKASSHNKPLLAARSGIPRRCLVSSNITGYFERLAADAENAVVDSLDKKTLASSLAELRALDARAPDGLHG